MNSRPKQKPFFERTIAVIRERVGVSNSISSRSPGLSRMPAYSTMPPSLISVPRPSTTVVEKPFAVTTRTGISTSSLGQRRVLGGADILFDDQRLPAFVQITKVPYSAPGVYAPQAFAPLGLAGQTLDPCSAKQRFDSFGNVEGPTSLPRSQFVRYGFIIDNRKCIGCHACTVACKTENHVPLTVNRTWVKYVEKGEFPNTRRVFQVTRCNHCENPPCVTICPVTAMYQRKDGIVDFSSERCIGCKACMQACPYDSIYIEPEAGTAAKCHFCAHRTEVGLEPSCVVVCPEHAIIAGDLDEPDGEIARLRNREPVRVRKPEQLTRPKLYYIDADEAAIVPTAARHETFYMAAQRNTNLHGGAALYPPDSPFLQQNALAAYDVSHARPWGWQVPAYCWTKGIGSGALAIPAIAMLFGRLGADRMRDIALSTIALLFTAITTVLLVADLEHKARFLRVVFTPQSKSWLARGAFILIGYSGLAGIFWLASFLWYTSLSAILIWPTAIVGLFAAMYTA